MLENTIRVWKLSEEAGAVEFDMPDATSLDAVTRQLPQGFYSTFRTYDGGKRVLGLRAHLERLYQPAEVQQIKPGVPANLLRSHLVKILGEYPGEARVRVIMTSAGHIYLVLSHLKSLLVEVYSQGVKVATTDVQRQNPRLKSTAFISASESTRAQIAGSDIFEALIVHNEFFLEGITSNFFYIKDGQLGTAREGILLGVTRGIVLRVARGSGFRIVYRALKREQVPDLSEAFITSSSRGIVPVIQIDDMPVGEGRPGSMTKRLSKAFDEYVIRHAEII